MEGRTDQKISGKIYTFNVTSAERNPIAPNIIENIFRPIVRNAKPSIQNTKAKTILYLLNMVQKDLVLISIAQSLGEESNRFTDLLSMVNTGSLSTPLHMVVI